MLENTMEYEMVPLLPPREEPATTPNGGLEAQHKNVLQADADVKEELLEALKTNNIDVLKSDTFKSYSNISYGTDKSSPLIIAAKYCSRECIKLLLKNGADPRYIDYRSRNPILVSAASGNLPCLELLIEAGVKAHYEFDNTRPLQGQATPPTADQQRRMEMEDHWMEQMHIELPTPRSRNRTPLHEAAENGYADCVLKLLNVGAKVDFGDCDKNTALHLAVRKELLDNGPHVTNNSDACIRALVDRGANISASNELGQSSLKLLIEQDSSYKWVKFLSRYFNDQVKRCNDCKGEKCIRLNFKSLCPQGKTNQNQVIYELMENLDKDNRRKLFRHPLLRAFVRYKWSSAKYVFYVYVAIFMLYVLSLSAFVTWAYCDIFYIFGQGWKFKTAQKGIPIARVILALTSILVAVNLIGLIYVLKEYRCKLAMWRNVIGVISTLVICFSDVYNEASALETKSEVNFNTSSNIANLSTTTETGTSTENGPYTYGHSNISLSRHHSNLSVLSSESGFFMFDLTYHITILAVFLAWLELMLLIGRFPKWAAQALLFVPVVENVLRILVTYGCLIIGFSFVFFFMFRKADSGSFGDPFRAIMTTVVMMTGEVDYVELFHDARGSEWTSSSLPFVARIVFLVFIITANIALMNLMLALAVSDTQNLIRLSEEKQLMQLARSVIHWGYMIESIEASTLTPEWLKTLIDKSKIEKEIHCKYVKKCDLPEELIKQLKSLSLKNSEHFSPEQAAKMDDLFNAIVALIESNCRGTRDGNMLRAQIDTLRDRIGY